MNLVTRCPGCNTLFRVTPPQLQVREGKVRCGRCMLVFDGLKMLAALPEASAAAQSPAPPSANPPSATAAVAAPQDAPADEQAAFARQPDSRLAEAAAPELAATGNPLTADEDLPGARPMAVLAQDQGAPEAASTGAPRRAAWAAGSLLLVLALAAQSVYVYRTELAAHYPGLRPLLVQACGALDCRVPLPQRHDLLKVEASDLQMIDPARPGLIQLTVILRNPAAHALAYPALDLVLTNSQDRTLARRIFLPAEYLRQDADAAAGIAPGAEITVGLDLDTGDLGATGFRLYMLPAPAG